MKKKNQSWIIYLSTFPPRECGIATFTKDLTDTFDDLFFPREESKIVAIDQSGSSEKYPKSVIFKINQEKKGDYIRVAQKLNEMSQVKLICIQHEFGIFGGEGGKYVLDFLREIKKPTIIVMHTVVPSMSPYFEKYKEIVLAVNDYVRCIIVMTKTSKKILEREYGIGSDKIKIIPHGIHPTLYQDSLKAKAELGLKKKTVVSTFGLLSRNKGIEYAIKAFPAVLKKIPNAVYLVVGATHPGILKKEGENYRNSLLSLVFKLKLEKNIIFYDNYFSTEKILKFLQATDVYLSTSLDPNQAVSGTLSYALGSGRPVVSTAFAQAKEDVTDEIGKLVDFRNSDEIAKALVEILKEKNVGKEMGKKAYFRTRKMTWPNTALAYMQKFIEIVPELGFQEKNLPKFKLRHLKKMTDDFGIFQFAKLTNPDPDFGYTLDDNARALIVAVQYYKKSKNEVALRLIQVYLEFIEFVFSKKDCQNYINHNKTVNVERNTREGLHDAYARGIYALAITAAAKNVPVDLKKRAAKIFQRKFNPKKIVCIPRPAAFYIKALCEWLKYDNSQKYQTALMKYSECLVEFYKKNSEPKWRWFEDVLTYSNGVIPEALLLAYQKTGNQKYFNIGKESLDFLIANSFKGRCCTPVGQYGWFRKGEKKTLFDQQPEEVAALVLASKAMYEASGDEKYKSIMRDAFDWFLGNNLLRQVVYSHISGGCYDGVGAMEVNLNQGAESTVSYLIARLAVD